MKKNFILRAGEGGTNGFMGNDMIPNGADIRGVTSPRTLQLCL